MSRSVGASLGYINMASNFGAVISPLIGGAMIDFFSKENYSLFNLSGISFLLIGTLLLTNAVVLHIRK